MPRQNLISAEVEDETVSSAIARIKDVNSSLPFMINLSPEERKSFRKMGPKSVDYVNDCLLGANQFTTSLSADFPLNEYSKDVTLINKLYPIFVASQTLTEALNDTLLALSSDAMKEADEVYESLKSAAKRDANAKALVQQIALRFKGQGKKKPE